MRCFTDISHLESFCAMLLVSSVACADIITLVAMIWALWDDGIGLHHLNY